MNKRIEVLKTGPAVDANGVPVNITDAMLADIAKSYDKRVHDASLVIGHPKMNDPAWGGTERFVVNGDRLEAEPCDVDPEFADLVNKKRYKSVSLALYGPKAPNNPAPGHWYARHVGFLGAMAPAIKGLNQRGLELNESEDGVYVFSAYTDSTVVSILRRWREWLIGKFGQEEADQVVPGYELDYLQQAATREAVQTETNAAPAFSEPGDGSSSQGDDDMSAQREAELQAQLDAANKQLKERDEQLVATATAAAAAAAAQRHTEALAFAEGLAGKWPVEAHPLIAEIINRLGEPSADGKQVEFGEGTDRALLVDQVRDLFESVPDRLVFGEIATRSAAGADKHAEDYEQIELADNADPARADLHRRTTRLMTERGITYDAALEIARKGA